MAIWRLVSLAFTTQSSAQRHERQTFFCGAAALPALRCEAVTSAQGSPARTPIHSQRLLAKPLAGWASAMAAAASGGVAEGSSCGCGTLPAEVRQAGWALRNRHPRSLVFWFDDLH